VEGHPEERAGAHEVVQYRGEILPLVDLRAMLGRAGGDDEAADAPLQVVVSSDKGRSFGLIVERILDIVEENISIKQRSSLRGILGAAIIQGKVTDLLDIRAAIQQADLGAIDAA